MWVYRDVHPLLFQGYSVITTEYPQLIINIFIAKILEFRSFKEKCEIYLSLSFPKKEILSLYYFVIHLSFL